MTLLGQTRQDLPFTACSHFQPTVLEGQLCYSLDLSKVAKDGSKSGLQSGLMMILDSSSNIDQEMETIGNNPLMKMKPSGHSSRIYLNTLASFTDLRAGSYAISAVKKMVATDTFLSLPVENRNCQLQTSEDCKIQQYVKDVQGQCGCVPWALASVLTLEVGLAPRVFQINTKSYYRLQLSVLQTPLPATQQSPETPTTARSPAPDSTLTSSLPTMPL